MNAWSSEAEKSAASTRFASSTSLRLLRQCGLDPQQPHHREDRHVRGVADGPPLSDSPAVRAPAKRAASRLAGRCHCGAVRVEIPRRPRTLTNCNCSICRRYGALWAYYKASEVRIEAAPGATEGYVWGDKELRFVRCRSCGSIVNWEVIRATEKSRVGINARNFEPDALGPVRIRRLDGAASWRFLADDE